MRRPALLAVVLAVLTVLAPATALATTGSAPANDADLDSAQDGAPSDPESDVLGWENGYWYNESIDVDQSDGLDDGELDAVVARAMARVEELRRLEFERTVPVEVYSRERLRQETSKGFNNSTAADRLHQNVKYEATFMVGEATNAVAVQQSNRGSSVGGYYSPTKDRIVVVADSSGAARIEESTLGHELLHALQDQKFGIESLNATTREDHNAQDGLIEGDANYLGYRYRQRCALPADDPNSWGSCLSGTSGGNASSGGDSIHFGLYLVVYQPYSDGPAFVRSVRERGGWSAVNDLYERVPASTEQTIHPAKYGQDAPTQVNITDRSNERWNVLDLKGSIDYAEFGEAGLASMFIYPTYASQGQGGLIPPQQFLNRNASGAASSFDPLNYNQSWSNGWDGDKLLPYVTNDSMSTNETGYVWKLHWDSPSEAREFRTGYQKLLNFHDATQVGQNTWVIEQGSYADAYHIAVDGNTTTIVNAPTVEDLSDVDGSVSVQSVENGTTGTDAGNASNGTGSAANGTGDAPETSSGLGPGFGVVAALVALLVVASLARRE